MPPYANPSRPVTNKVVPLMTGKVGPARQKAIITLAKRKNIGLGEARFYQAQKIAVAQVRKGL